jgi:hypothetical protein
LFNYIDSKKDHPGKQIQDWIDMGFKVGAVKQNGVYIDTGTIEGIKQLYKKI